MVMRRPDCRQADAPEPTRARGLPRRHRLRSKRQHPQIKELAAATLAGHGHGAGLCRQHPGVHPGHEAQGAADEPGCVGILEERSEHDLHGQCQPGLRAHAGEADTVPIDRDLPTIPRRFEMHRIVEYADNGAWIPFDPSRVYADIPLKPWQNIIMAKTTPPDEEEAMKPRVGAMVGCPFGHEIEFSRPGLNLFGQDFFWTIAAPLAEFEVTDEAATLTAGLWERYLKTGALSASQFKAASARDLGQYLEAMKLK